MSDQTAFKSRDEMNPFRVLLEYPVELMSRTHHVELPFVLGVLSDLMGSRLYEPGSLRDREFQTVDRDNFDGYLKSLCPRLQLLVPDHINGVGELALDLGFECMADFEPGRLVRQVPALRLLLARRDEAINALKQGNGSAADVEDFDEKLSRQLTAILQHPDFQRLEGRWRGLHFLVNRAPRSRRIKIRVLPLSRKELMREARLYAGHLWDQSVLFHRLYIEEHGTLGGEPLACFIADFQFDHSPADVTILRLLSRIGAASDAPFLAGLAPAYFHLERWSELGGGPSDVRFNGEEYADWRALRAHPDSRFIGLTASRFLARLPYGTAEGRQTNPDFPFDEKIENPLTAYAWCNTAYLVGHNLLRAFGDYSWSARIRGFDSGGFIDELHGVTVPNSHGGISENSPMEVAVFERMEAELVRQGLMVPMSRKDGGVVAFFSASMLHKPAEYDNPEGTHTARLGSWLHYLMAVCRFTHYLKCISRDCFWAQQDVENSLNEWLSEFVDPDPDHSGDREQAKYPLLMANVEIETKDSMLEVTFRCQPNYQLEGLRMPLMHRFRMPNANYRPSSLH